MDQKRANRIVFAALATLISLACCFPDNRWQLLGVCIVPVISAWWNTELLREKEARLRALAERLRADAERLRADAEQQAAAEHAKLASLEQAAAATGQRIATHGLPRFYTGESGGATTYSVNEAHLAANVGIALDLATLAAAPKLKVAPTSLVWGEVLLSSGGALYWKSEASVQRR